jgi:hypothetical protein
MLYPNDHFVAESLMRDYYIFPEEAVRAAREIGLFHYLEDLDPLPHEEGLKRLHLAIERARASACRVSGQA